MVTTTWLTIDPDAGHREDGTVAPSGARGGRCSLNAIGREQLVPDRPCRAV